MIAHISWAPWYLLALSRDAGKPRQQVITIIVLVAGYQRLKSLHFGVQPIEIYFV